MISQKVEVEMTCTFAWCFHIDCSLNCHMGLAILVFKKIVEDLRKIYKNSHFFNPPIFLENKYR